MSKTNLLLVLSSVIFIGPYNPSIYRELPNPLQRLSTFVCTLTAPNTASYCYDITEKAYTEGQGKYFTNSIQVVCNNTEYEFSREGFFITITPYSAPYVTYKCN